MAGIFEKRESKKSRRTKSERRKEKAIDSRKVDFSRQAVNKEVAIETLQKPYVLYPFGIGILGGVAALLFGGNVVLAAAAATGAVIGIGSWILNNTLRKQVYVGKYLSRMNTMLASQTKLSIRDLRKDLQEVDEQQGLKQIDLLQNKYDAFNGILATKFDQSEISFNRYHAMVEQVFLAVLDNLNQVANIRKGINVIDENHIANRIRQLKATEQTATGREELDALIGRYKLLQQQRDMVQKKLAQNESAMTKMDEVMAAISIINPVQSRASMDMEDAMKELETLAKRATSYSSS